MDTIKVKDERGKDVELEILEMFSIDKNEYAIVSPMGSDEAYAYKTFIKNGEREFISLGEGAEFDKVLEKYNSIVSEE